MYLPSGVQVDRAGTTDSWFLSMLCEHLLVIVRQLILSVPNSSLVVGLNLVSDLEFNIAEDLDYRRRRTLQV